MASAGKPWGLLVSGVGAFGAQRASAATRARGLRLVAVTDLDPARAERVAALHGAVAVPDLASGLASGGVDAVVVATPHGDHAGSVRLALEAGKHVFCEKPLAVRVEDARALAILADESRLRLAVGSPHRFDPPVRDALALVGSWAIGRVLGVRVDVGHLASPAFLRSWRTEVGSSGGGTLVDDGPIACDLIRRFLGEIVLAKGFVRQDVRLPAGCESEAFGLFRDHDDGFAELRASWSRRLDGPITLEVRGVDGHLRVDSGPWRLNGRLADGRRVDRRYRLDRIADRLHLARFGCPLGLVRELESFAADAANPRPGASGWDGCRAVEMIQALYQSDRLGDEVHLKPPLVNLPSAARRRAVRGRNR